jgi:hypothetical protein
MVFFCEFFNHFLAVSGKIKSEAKFGQISVDVESKIRTNFGSCGWPKVGTTKK